LLKRIHVNQHIIRANQKRGARDAPITVKTYRSNIRAHRVAIHGPSQLVYSPDHPLPCGARLWLETEAHVVAFDDSLNAEVDLR
jgi:hypothetical protein